LQLYVSVDAGTKDSLKAIDRPLFGDFWERFIVSIFSFSVEIHKSVIAS
jgi:tRNA wybutosine-synthesizing protein 1